MTPNLIRADSAQWMIRQANEHGIATKLLLTDTGLDRNWNQNTNAVISYPQYCKIILNMLDETNDPGIGLSFAARFNVTEFGFIGYAFISCQTLKEALKVGHKFWELGGQLMTLAVTRDSQFLKLAIHPASPLIKDRILVYAAEEAFATIMVAASFATKRSLELEKIHFSYPAPPHENLYRKTFDCPVLFNQKENLLFIRSELLSLPIPTASPEVAVLVKKECEELLLGLRKADNFVKKVRRILINSMGQFPSSSDTAKKLGMSSSTFYRRLKKKNTSFQKIFNEVRTEIAMKYLSETNLSIDQISDLVGFSETTTFRSTFKKWTGQSASGFRKENDFMQ